MKQILLSLFVAGLSVTTRSQNITGAAVMHDKSLDAQVAVQPNISTIDNSVFLHPTHIRVPVEIGQKPHHHKPTSHKRQHSHKRGINNKKLFKIFLKKLLRLQKTTFRIL